MVVSAALAGLEDGSAGEMLTVYKNLNSASQPPKFSHVVVSATLVPLEDVGASETDVAITQYLTD